MKQAKINNSPGKIRITKTSNLKPALTNSNILANLQKVQN